MPWRDVAHLRQASVIRKPHQYSLWDTFNNCEKEEQQNMWKFDDNLEQFAEPRSGIHFKLGDSGGSGSSPYTCWAVTDYVCGTLKTRPSRAEPLHSGSMPFHVMQKFLSKITRCLQRQALLLGLLLVIWTNTLSVFLLQNFTLNSMHYMLLYDLWNLWNLLKITKNNSV